MDLDAVLEARLMNSNRRLKRRRARSANQKITEFFLEHVKIGIRELDPAIDPESPGFRTAVVLMAAAFVVGPHVDLLVQFTGYSMTFVANIARRMRAYELWSDDEVCTEYWFEGDRITAAFWFWSDCLVADGLLRIDRDEDGERLYTAVPYPN
jgi:hypothetical protein